MFENDNELRFTDGGMFIDQVEIEVKSGKGGNMMMLYNNRRGAPC
jgi:hypothetical protein